MGLVVLVSRDSRGGVSDLCERTAIPFEWRDDGHHGLVTVNGSDEEYRFFLRRLETKKIDYQIVSLDGKELRGGEGEMKGQSVFE